MVRSSFLPEEEADAAAEDGGEGGGDEIEEAAAAERAAAGGAAAGGGGGEVARIGIGRLRLTCNSLRSLRPKGWVNDEVVNCYSNLIHEKLDGKRAGVAVTVKLLVDHKGLPNVLAAVVGEYLQPPACCFMSSFLVTQMIAALDKPGAMPGDPYKAVARWHAKAYGTPNVTIVDAGHDMVFFPVWNGVHWSLGVINFRDKRIVYYDSWARRVHRGTFSAKVLGLLKTYMECEAQAGGTTFDFEAAGWQNQVMAADEIPQQDNPDDCGVFMCKYIEFLSENRPLNFSACDIPRVRYRMMLSLASGRISLL